MSKTESGEKNTFFSALPKVVKKGSFASRFSILFMGAGQIMRGQIVKGAIYLFLEVLFVVYMILFGGTYIAHIFSGHLGKSLASESWNEEKQIFEKTAGDNSFLILLYAVVTVVVVCLFVVLWFMNVKGNAENDERKKKGLPVSGFKSDVRELFDRKLYIPLLFAPFVGLLVFTVMPLVFMVLIAFTNYDYNHTPPGRLFDWVGIANFRNMFSFANGGEFASAFLRVLLWTFAWAFFATFTNYFLGMVIALMINKKGIKFKKVFRTLFVIAIAVPQFVTLLLMQKILDRSGILNVVLHTDVLWLTDTRFGALIPKIVIILVNVWIGVPYTLLMCSGLLLNIPADMYEAGRIDGANAFQLFMKITLPYMIQMTTPYLITQFVGNVNNFNVIWLLSGGGPVDSVRFGSTQAQSTDLLVTWLYRLTTDVNPRYNVASVIGIVIFVLSATLSLITYSKTGASKNEEAFQ